MDRFDYGWDPHEREEAVWRDPTSRTQIYVGDNTDVVPLDEQGVLTDREDDTADPHYVPGRRRAEEVDPDQSDIEDQFLSRVRQPSQSPPSTSTRTVHLAEEGAVRQALQRGNPPSAPARSSHSKIPKGFQHSTTLSPPTSVGRAKSAGAQDWFQTTTHLEGAYPRERTPRTRKPPPAAPEVSQAGVTKTHLG